MIFQYFLVSFLTLYFLFPCDITLSLSLPFFQPLPLPFVSQITQLKIDHNPFAKGFRDNYDT